jgi:TetR/AcrR family transcriptional regulator, cholesterol catabolism regulator
MESNNQGKGPTAMKASHELSAAIANIRGNIRDSELLANKRKRILQATVSVFEKKGYHKTTVRDIAKAAGVSMGSLYDCISTKGDVLLLFYDQFIESFQNGLITKTGGITHPGAKLKVAYISLLEAYYALKDEVLFGWTEAKNMKKAHLKGVLKAEKLLVNYFKGMLDEMNLQPNVKIEDTYLVASFLVYGALFGILRGWELNRKYRKQEVIEWLVNTQLETILREVEPRSCGQT